MAAARLFIFFGKGLYVLAYFVYSKTENKKIGIWRWLYTMSARFTGLFTPRILENVFFAKFFIIQKLRKSF